MSTKERLAQELTKAHAPAFMIAKAKAGEYDDFQSSSATPINDLVRDCRKAGLNDLASRAMNGNFDGTKEEGEAWFERFHQ